MESKQKGHIHVRVSAEDAKRDFNERGVSWLRLGNKSLDEAQDLLSFFGMSGDDYILGGRTSVTTQEHWAGGSFRRMDHYPKHLSLLPNNEVQYLNEFPLRVMLFFRSAGHGKVTIHSAKEVESHLQSSPTGRNLLDKLERYGMMNITGFLHEDDPAKPRNYFKSWQEKTGRRNLAEAIKVTESSCDRAYARQGPNGFPVLMTEVTLPAFAEMAGERYLRFPRIAGSPPELENGFRRFPLGNREELSEEEKAALLSAYQATGKGYYTQNGDIILMDNIRYGHGRGPYQGRREVLVAMSGTGRLK